MYYKAPDNSPHFLDDDSFAYLLPAGSVPISEEEALELGRLKSGAPVPAEPQLHDQQAPADQ